MPDAKSIRSGGAHVELSVRDSRLVKGLQAAEQRLRAFGASVTGLGARLTALGGAALAPIIGMAHQFRVTGDALNKMAARTGISTEALSELGFAAEQSGADINILEIGIRMMQRAIVDAANGSREVQSTLAKLGLTIADLKALTPDEQFSLLADRIAQIGNPTLRAAIAMDIFGRAGQKLVPLLSAGAKGIDELRAEARALGLTVGTDQAQAAADLQDAWNRLLRTLKAASFTIGAALASDLTTLFGVAKQFIVGAIRWASANRKIIVTTAAVIASVVGVGAALIVIGGVISFAGAAIGGLVSVIVGLKIALFAIFSPIGLISTAILGLAGYLVYTSDAGSQALGWLGNQFSDLKETATATWKGISDALAAGDIELAARILWAALRMEFNKGLLWLQEKWLGFKAFFVEAFNDLVYGLADRINNAWAGLQVAWIKTLGFLGDGWTRFIAFLQRGWLHFGGFFKRVWARIKGLFGADAEAEIARINQEIAAESAAINARRDAKLASNQAERRRRLDAIENERAGIGEELWRMQQEERAKREADRQAQLAKTARDLEAARQEWQAALAEAQRKRNEADAKKPPKPKRPNIPSLDEVTDTARKKVDVQGTFNALAIRGLGATSLAERIAKATEQTATSSRRLLELAREGGVSFE